MEYNENFFGVKQDVYNNANSTQLYCAVASQNSTLSAGLKTGAYQINNNIDDSVFYWLVNSESPYTRLSLINLISSGGTNTVNKVDTDTKNEHLPLVLTWQNFKINANYDVDTTGTLPNQPKNIIPNRRFVQSMFKTQGDVDNPLLYNTNGLSDSAKNNNFNKAPFVVDFDYNNIIATIQVGTGASSNVQDLANYNNTVDNYISTISLAFYIGEIDDNNTTRVNSYIQQRYINGVNCGGAQNNGMTIVSDYRYKTPDVLRNAPFYYNIDEFNFFQAVTTSTYTTALFSGTLASGANFYNVSYYMDNDHWELNDNNNGYRLKKHGNGVYNDDDFDYIRKCVAYLGFWFTDGGYYTDSEHSYNIYRHNTKLGNNANEYADSYMIPDHVYQSEIKDGITTGNYTELRIAKDNEQSKWGKDWREKNGYEGRDKTSPTDESSKSSKTMYESTFASFGRIYKCFPPSAMYPNGTIQSLADQLRSYIFSGNYDGSLFYNQNPVDCITSIKEYPFDISDYIETLGTELIQLGRWRVQTSDRPELYCPFVRIKSSSTPIFYGSLSIPSSFKTIGYEFLDYEPYSKYDLYLPFCGTINIPSALAVETLIEVLYFIDLLSGCCIAHIYIDNKYYCSAQGQVAVEIPVSGYQIGNYTRDMLNATYAQKQAYANVASDVGRLITSIGGSAIGMGINSKVGYGGSNPITIPDPINPAMALFSGTAGGLVNAGQIISGAGKAIQAGAAMASHYETIKYNKSILSHSAPAPIKSSLGGGIINWESPYYVEMLVQRPIFMTDYDEETYKATLGKACHIADTLANHSGGYVEAINCNLSGFPATQPEKVELAKLLADGVFL